MEKKVCNKCCEEKNINNFSNDKTKSDGLRTICKECCKINNSLLRTKDVTKYNQIRKIYRKLNKEKIKEYRVKWESENKNYYIEYQKNRIKKDLLFRFIRNIRSRMWNYFKKNNISKRNRTFDIIGCSPEFLKEHIENQFTKGMSWELLGQRIHIDHIIPLSSADTEEEIYKLCHYTNLQPLWAEDNLKKGSKI